MRPWIALVALVSLPLLAGGGDTATVAGPNVTPATKGAPGTAATGAKAATIADAWRALGTTTNACSERDLHFDYWPDGGVRNFWCHATSVLAWKAFVALAPHKPFSRGPHTQGKLALHDPRDFGRYNPAFVRWLVDNGVPAASDEALRAQTQPLYEKYVRQLARVYYVVHERLEQKPAWKKQQRNLYLKTMDEKNPDWGAYYDKYSTFLGEADSDWGGYDPNLQSASVAFWLRRDVDGTAPIFFEGLKKLLGTYDAAFLTPQKH